MRERMERTYSEPAQIECEPQAPGARTWPLQMGLHQACHRGTPGMKSYFGNIMLPSCYITITVYATFRLGNIGIINIQVVIVMVNFKYFMKAVKKSIWWLIVQKSHKSAPYLPERARERVTVLSLLPTYRFDVGCTFHSLRWGKSWSSNCPFFKHDYSHLVWIIMLLFPGKMTSWQMWCFRLKTSWFHYETPVEMHELDVTLPMTVSDGKSNISDVVNDRRSASRAVVCLHSCSECVYISTHSMSHHLKWKKSYFFLHFTHKISVFTVTYRHIQAQKNMYWKKVCF